MTILISFSLVAILLASSYFYLFNSLLLLEKEYPETFPYFNKKRLSSVVAPFYFLMGIFLDGVSCIFEHYDFSEHEKLTPKWELKIAKYHSHSINEHNDFIIGNLQEQIEIYRAREENNNKIIILANEINEQQEIINLSLEKSNNALSLENEEYRDELLIAIKELALVREENAKLRANVYVLTQEMNDLKKMRDLDENGNIY